MEREVGDSRFEFLAALGDDAGILLGFCDVVRGWWRGKFAGFSLPQGMAGPAGRAGRHVLVCAPAGAGETVCAFIGILDDLISRSLRGELGEGVDTVYVSPLRALGRDIEKNLVGPLAEMRNAECGMRNE